MEYEFYDSKEILIKELTTMRKFFFIESGSVIMSRLNGSKHTYEKYDMIGEPLLLLWAKKHVFGDDFKMSKFIIKTRYTAQSKLRLWTLDYSILESLFETEISKKDQILIVNTVLEHYNDFIKDLVRFDAYDPNNTFEKTHDHLAAKKASAVGLTREELLKEMNLNRKKGQDDSGNFFNVNDKFTGGNDAGN